MNAPTPAQAAPASPDLECRRCGTGTAEPEAAKVIVVERDGHPARFFAAVSWEVLTSGVEAGDLTLTADTGECVAQLGARMWDSACDAEAILPADLYARQGKKLAMDALRKIDQDGDDYSARATAEEALANIADVDL